MIRVALWALLSHWRRRKAQLLTLVLGLALATALWSGVQALNAEARASYARAERDISAASLPQILGTGAPTLTDFVTLRRGGWLVTPIVEGRTVIDGLSLRVLGLDPLTAPDSLAPSDLRPEALRPELLGSEVRDLDPQAAAPEEARAEPLDPLPSGDQPPGDLRPGDLPPGDLPPGDQPLAPLPPEDQRRGDRPLGDGAQSAAGASADVAGRWIAAPALAKRLGALPAADLPPDLIVTELAEAQRLLGLGSSVSRLALLPDQPLRQAPLESLGPYRLVAAEPQPDLGQMTGSFHLNLTAFGLLAFAVGLFVVQGTIGLAFEERRPTFRTLRALGLPLSSLALALTLELTSFALVGGVLGVVLGGVLASLLLPDVSASLSGLYGAAIPAVLSLRAEWWATGLAMALGGTWIAGATALWRLARLPLLAPARPRAWALASKKRALRLAGIGLVLCLIAAGIFAFATSLFAGFAGLAALMLGAALMLPFALGLLLGIGQSRAKSPQARWLWADTAQQVPGLSLALAALLLALSANIGVSTMVGSFRGTFLGWLDQRLSAELYVTTKDEDQSARFAAWATPRAEAVLPIWSAEDQISGQSVELYGLVDDPLYREKWPVLETLPEAWDLLAAENGVLISEQLARRLHLSLGEAISLSGWQTKVVGIYSDYGNPSGQLLLALDKLLALYPETQRLRYGLRVAPGEVQSLRDAISAEFGLLPEQVTDQLAQKRAAIAIFDRTFLVTGALNILTLGVAAFAMFTSLLTLARMRLPQLAPVWAMGLTRKRLALLDLARTLALALLTWLLALPLGLTLAWALLARINVAAFGWRLPLSLDPVSLLGLLGGALLAALAASIIPALKLARLPPSALLRVFSSER